MSILFGTQGLNYTLPDGTRLFSNLDFHLPPGRTALVGRNGTGKSTLLDLLAGKRSPASGTMLCDCRIAYLPQSVTIDPAQSVAHVLGVGKRWETLRQIEKGEADLHDFDAIAEHWDLPARIETVLGKVGASYLSPEDRMETLSGGEIMRIQIAALLLVEPEVILLDEPTNHLDQQARSFIYQLVDTWTSDMLLVSHDRALLGRVDQIAELTSGGIRLYGGNYAFYKEQKQLERDAAERLVSETGQTLRQARKKAIEMQERQTRRSSAGKKHGQRTGMSKMQMGNLQRAAENTAGRLGHRHDDLVAQARQRYQSAKTARPADHQIQIDLNHSTIPAGKRVVEAQALQYCYPGQSRNLWHPSLNFRIQGGDRVAIIGPNGSGKTTLVDLIMNTRQPTGGTLHVGTSRIAYLDQHVSLLDDETTLLANMQRVSPGRPEHELRILLGRFLFEKEAVFKIAGTLSGGERMRAGLACALISDQAPELLILDEPTNNLDLPSLEEMTFTLKQFAATLLVISHDETFLEEIGVNRAIELSGR